MKVVQINCVSFGSMGKIARSIHSALLERGDESHVFFGGGSKAEVYDNYFVLTKDGVVSEKRKQYTAD